MRAISPTLTAAGTAGAAAGGAALSHNNLAPLGVKSPYDKLWNDKNGQTGTIKDGELVTPKEEGKEGAEDPAAELKRKEQANIGVFNTQEPKAVPLSDNRRDHTSQCVFSGGYRGCSFFQRKRSKHAHANPAKFYNLYQSTSQNQASNYPNRLQGCPLYPCRVNLLRIRPPDCNPARAKMWRYSNSSEGGSPNAKRQRSSVGRASSPLLHASLYGPPVLSSPPLLGAGSSDAAPQPLAFDYSDEEPLSPPASMSPARAGVQSPANNNNNSTRPPVKNNNKPLFTIDDPWSDSGAESEASPVHHSPAPILPATQVVEYSDDEQNSPLNLSAYSVGAFL